MPEAEFHLGEKISTDISQLGAQRNPAQYAPRAILIAVLVCSLSSAIILAGFLSLPRNDGLIGFERLRDFMKLIALFGLFTLGASTVLGLPTFWLYRHFSWRSVQAYAAGGIIIAALTVFFFSLVGAIRGYSLGSTTAFLLAGIGGAVTFRLMLDPRLKPNA